MGTDIGSSSSYTPPSQTQPVVCHYQAIANEDEEDPTGTLVCSEPVAFVCNQCDSTSPPCLLCADHDKEYHSAGNTRRHKRTPYSTFSKFTNAMYYQCSENDLVVDHRDNLFFGKNESLEFCLGPKYHSLGQTIESDDPIAVISFIAPTGNGKSQIIRILNPEEPCLPLSAPIGSLEATSSDLHVYQSTWDLPWRDRYRSFPTLFFDSEGLRGADAPRQQKALQVLDYFPKLGKSASDVEKKEKELRLSLVGMVYPRLLYMFSDVIVYPFVGSPAEVQQYAGDLLLFSNIAAARTVNNPVPPILCLVFNKRSIADCSAYLGPKGIPRATEDWCSANADIANQLKGLFREIYVVHLPNFMDYPTESILQVQKFRNLVTDCVLSSLQTRDSFKVLQNRKNLLPSMWKIASGLYKNSKSTIDMYEILMNDQQLMGVNGTSHFLNYWKIFSNNYSKEQNLEATFQSFADRVARALLLRWSRHKKDIGGSAPVEKELRGDWIRELKALSNQILQDHPCTAEAQFHCAKKGDIRVRCELLAGCHGDNHKSSEVYMVLPTYPSLLAKMMYPDKKHVPHACTWPGDFQPPGLKREDFTKMIINKFNELDLQQCQLSIYHRAVREDQLIAHVVKYPALCNQTCLICLCDFPSVTLTGCGHSICRNCYNDFAWPFKECPICKRKNVFSSIREIPKHAGYRILSLDGGGGTQGLITLRILQEIQELTDMQIYDLFDLVIGTSEGGIIALYSTAGYEKEFAVQQCQAMLKKITQEVFSSTCIADKLKKLASTVLKREYPKYDRSKLEVALKNDFPDNFPQVPLFGCTREGPVVAVTTMEVSSKELQLACNTAVPGDRHALGRKCKVYEAALCACVPPTNLQPYKLQSQTDGKQYVDGGLLANCPAEKGLHLSSTLWPDMSVDALVSVGTGYYEPEKKEGSNMNSINSVDWLVDSEKGPEKVQVAVDNMLKVPGDDTLRFCRLNPTLSGVFELDASSPEDIERVEDTATEWIENNSDLVESICGRLIACQLYFDTPGVEVASIFNGHVRARSCKLLNEQWWDIVVELRKDSNETVNADIHVRERKYDAHQAVYPIEVSRLEKGIYNIWIMVQTKFGRYPISGCPITIFVDPGRFFNYLNPEA